jgi:phosphohistidine phosphatase SixA
MAPEEAIHHLQAFHSFGSLLLVGHQPDLALLASAVLGSIDPERLHVRKASTLHLKFISRTAARLEALIPCPALP